MFTLIYDRNFNRYKDRQHNRESRFTEKVKEWSHDEDPPDIMPHRVIELWAEGKERQFLESIMSGGNMQEMPTEEIGYYGDMARTMFINL